MDGWGRRARVPLGKGAAPSRLSTIPSPPPLDSHLGPGRNYGGHVPRSSVSPGRPQVTAVGYGIDFGTSNSAIAAAHPDRVDVIPAGASGARTLPSLVYLHRDGRRQAGEEGVQGFLRSGHEKTDCWRCPLAPYGWDTDCRQYTKGGGCNDARLLAGVKHDLAKPGFAGTNSWATDFPVADLVAIVLLRLKGEADRATGADVRRLVLGHPVVFAGSDPDHRDASHQEALARLREGAVRAGFEQVEFLPEPTAAVVGEPNHHGVELAVDFGGGTFDVAVMDSRGGDPRLAATGGIAIGGELLDGVLFETRIGPALGLDVLPNWLFNEMRTSSSVRLLMADPGIPLVLARLGGRAAQVAGRLLFEGHAYDFYRALEAAKIALSDSETAQVRYPAVGLDLPLQRAAFETMIRPELDLVRGVIESTLVRAAVRPEQVDRVLLTGGSAQIPAFRRDLATMFGEERLEQRDAFTAVVHGLGVRAQQLWGEVGGGRLTLVGDEPS